MARLIPYRVRNFLVSLLLLPAAALAAYPEKPITLVVAYSPGGGTDLIARAVQPFLEKYIGGGARVILVHRPGAGGEIGFAAIANAAADGYTIGFVNTPPLMTIPIERKAQLAAPKGLPPEIRERLVKAVESAYRDPEFQAQATKFFAPLRFLTPAQFEQVIREADTGFKQLWKEIPWGDK